MQAAHDTAIQSSLARIVLRDWEGTCHLARRCKHLKARIAKFSIVWKVKRSYRASRLVDWSVKRQKWRERRSLAKGFLDGASSSRMQRGVHTYEWVSAADSISVTRCIVRANRRRCHRLPLSEQSVHTIVERTRTPVMSLYRHREVYPSAPLHPPAGRRCCS